MASNDPPVSVQRQRLNSLVRDPDYAAFEFDYFLTGSDCGGEGQDYISIHRVRVPRLHAGKKAVIDYSVLDAPTHSKAQLVT